MADKDKLRFLTGQEANLKDKTLTRGQVYFAINSDTDSGKIYFDAPIDKNTTKRILMSSDHAKTADKATAADRATADSNGRKFTETYVSELKLDNAGTTILYKYPDITTWKELKPKFLPLTGGTITGELYADSITAGDLLVNGSARFVNTILGNIETANQWKTARGFQIADSDAAHTSSTVNVDGSGNVVLKLPSIIQGSFIGNLSGNADSANKINHLLTYTKHHNGDSQTFDGSINVEIKPTFADLHPLISKKYESETYYASSNDNNGASFFFMSVKPDSWYKPWTVRIKVHTYCPNYPNVDSVTYSTISGRANSIIYANWNERYDSGHYYISTYPLTNAGFTKGYGHAVGINLVNSTNRTTASYYRTFEIDYYDSDNCTVTFLDAPVKWNQWKDVKETSVVGNSTNYSGIFNTNAIDRGLQETGDADSFAYNVSEQYYRRRAGVNGFYGYNIVTLDTDGKLSGFTTSYGAGTTKGKNNVSFQINAPFYYYSSGTNRAAGVLCDYGQLRTMYSLVDVRYSLNCGQGSLVPNEPLYLVGDLANDYSSYTLADTWWTQTLPTSDDNKIYIFLGMVYPDGSTYRISWGAHHQAYWFKNGKLRDFYQTGAYIPSGGIAGQILTSSGSAMTSWVNSNTITAGKALTLNTARKIAISDNDATNTGVGVDFDGSKDIVVHLPSTIKATLKGNADTATKATNDSNNKKITDEYLHRASNTSSTLNQFSGAPNYILGIESFTDGGEVKWQVSSSVKVGSADGADKWNTAVNFQVSDSDAAHTGTAVSVNGSKAIVLPLPATIKATLEGNASSANKVNHKYTLTLGSTAQTAFDGSADVAITITPKSIGALASNANAVSASKWSSARTFYVADSDASNTGEGVSVDGSKDITLKLPSTIKASITGHASEDLALSGGTMTGNISYKGSKATNSMIRFLNNTTDTSGNGISIGGGGVTVIGAGESSQNLTPAANEESLYLMSDGSIKFYTYCDTIGNKRGVILDTSRNFYPDVNNSGSIGTSSNKWASMYATTFYGALSGTASHATSDVRGNAIIDTYLTNVYAKSDDSSYLYKQVGPSSERSAELIGRYTPLDSDGLINMKYIPAAALERVVVVANQAAQYALTTANVQLGDVVKRNDTGQLYFVVDTNNLGNANGYLQFTAGTAANVNWSGILNRPNVVGSASTKDIITLNDAKTVFTINRVNGDGTSDSYTLSPSFLPLAGGTITGKLSVNGETTLANLIVNGDASFVNIIQGSISGNAGSATKWATAKAFYIADAEAKHTSSPQVNIDGSQSSYTLKLPSTIKATLEGNADTATKLTNLTEADKASSTNTWRRVWFAYDDNVNGRPAYSDTFAYQSSTGTVKATKFQGALVGNATSADKWKTARSFITNLGSETSASVDGSTGPYNLGVTGTLPVSHGGTGNTTQIAKRAIYSETATKLSSSGHYMSSSKMAINSTSEPTETFFVNGSTRLGRNKVLISSTTLNGDLILSALGYKTGYPLYTDPLFKTGTNSVRLYNNSSTAPYTTVTRVKWSDIGVLSPGTDSDYIIKIENTQSGTSPGLGGFYQTINSRAGAIFVQIFRAMIPTGYSLSVASNYMGSGYKDEWITDNKGTGKWEWYARRVICGSEGSFSNGGHVYLSGTAGVTWYLASCNCYDVTKEDYDGLKTRMADQWTSTHNFRVTDNGAANSGAWVSIDGSAPNYTLQLPSTIKATLNGNADTATLAINANGLKNQGTLDSQEKIDGFLVANSLQYATFKTAEQNNIGMGSNDGMIISIPWTSTSYGAQIAFDDNKSGIVKFRAKNTDWGSWLTLLHSGNYNDFAVKKASASTDNAIVRWDGTDGRRIQNSLLSINDEGLLTLQTGNHIGAKLGSAYITSANSSNGEILLQNGHLRFGSDSWDYNQWAGLKYVHSSKIIYLGLADGTIFNANSAQSGGTLALPGIRYFSINGKIAIDANDGWLRINEGKAFATGIYFGSNVVRTDGQFQVGDSGNKFYANSSGNGYFSNTLGIGGTNTSYKLYVNGTSYINGNTTVNGWLKVQNTTDSKNSQDSNASLAIQGGVSVAKQLSAKTVRIDGSSSDTTGSTTQGCTVHFNKTNNCIEFVFD